MCGIVGLSFALERARDWPSVRSALAAATEAMSHRGPDGQGLFFDAEAGIGLGHRRLAILDLSPTGHQPMVSDDGRVVLAFNGEIYNHQELRAGLEAQGIVFRGHSDTETVLRLYERDGEAILARLNGIFSLAIWDERCARMLVARDAMGVKPLYISETASGVAFASEIKALMPMVPDPGGLDAVAVDRYLSFLWCPGDRTPWSGVRKIAPGEALWLNCGVIERRWQWYRPPVFSVRKASLSRSDAVSGTLSHLRCAVVRQIVADVPVGAFLSGGLDSSAIVALAREKDPSIRCFTIEAMGGQDEGVADDLPYARQVAKHLNVDLEVVRVDSSRMAQDLATMVAHLDEPLADPAPLNVLYISRLAREHGIKVLLSGAGGDDLFTGYRRHRAVLAERYWSWLPRPVRAGLARLAGGLNQRRTLFRKLNRLLSGAALDGDERLIQYFRWTRREDLRSLYTTAFRGRITEDECEAPMRDWLSLLPARTHRLERMLALEQRFFLADHNLIYTDKMAMAAGVEVRVPFLDLELVEFAARIPVTYKQRGAVGKWILKEAMAPYLPQTVIHRPKSGFGAPLRRWMRVELRYLLSDVLGAPSLTRRGVFEPAAVQRLIAANDSGRVDASYTLLSLLCIELWCRHFLDRVPPMPDAAKTTSMPHSLP